MKTHYVFFILSLIIITTSYSCVNKTIDKEVRYYNGVDSQILSIIDSMRIYANDIPFITVWFTMNNNKNVVRFLNTYLEPVPVLPPTPVKHTSISEDEDFRGYKKYNSIYLVFLESKFSDNLKKFVEKDSLNFDEIPFSTWNPIINRFDRKGRLIEKIYLINKNDSLVFIEEEQL